MDDVTFLETYGADFPFTQPVGDVVSLEEETAAAAPEPPVAAAPVEAVAAPEAPAPVEETAVGAAAPLEEEADEAEASEEAGDAVDCGASTAESEAASGSPSKRRRNGTHGFWVYRYPRSIGTLIVSHRTPKPLATLNQLLRRVWSVLAWTEDNGARVLWTRPSFYSAAVVDTLRYEAMVDGVTTRPTMTLIEDVGTARAFLEAMGTFPEEFDKTFTGVDLDSLNTLPALESKSFSKLSFSQELNKALAAGVKAIMDKGINGIVRKIASQSEIYADAVMEHAVGDFTTTVAKPMSLLKKELKSKSKQTAEAKLQAKLQAIKKREQALRDKLEKLREEPAAKRRKQDAAAPTSRGMDVEDGDE